jgi:hypothetical protein
MKKNIGTKDRLIRLLLGIVCFVLAFTVANSSVLKIILVIAGVFCLFQAVFSWCLWYQIIGKNTCPVE